jgi:hypothetical protein
MNAYWWFSFANPYAERSKQFLGVVIIESDSPHEALMKIIELKINPGGEVRSYAIPINEETIKTYKPHLNKLLSKKDLLEKDLGESVIP